MRNVSNNFFLEKINTHILCSVNIFENRAVYEIIWYKIVETDRSQITV